MTTSSSKNNKKRNPPEYKCCIKRIKNYLEKHKDYLYDESKEQYFNYKCIGPFISLVFAFILVSIFSLIFCRPIIVIIKESICRFLAVAFGFLLAAGRSWIKDWRLIEDGKKEPKPRIDMLWPYFINYPLTLTFIYVLGSYFLDKQEPCVSWAILFILGFGVDSIFYLITHPGDLLQDLLHKT